MGWAEYIEGWEVTLLKTEAQAIPNFWMSLLLLPGEIYDELEKRMNAYWWVEVVKSGAWRLVNNLDSLVMELMKARYYAHTDLLNADIGTNPSYMWRSIFAAQQVIRQGCRRKIENGV
ncbi:putative mitochondrial protein AtMg00310 [Apium graveolens]|uniref:putative mitochondrial protein AtMg00310 n=1 Tax=Apium graveolens TaxID=4045 RepID=UPI003D7A052A